MHTPTHPEGHRESPSRYGLFVRAVSFSPKHVGHSDRDKATKATHRFNDLYS